MDLNNPKVRSTHAWALQMYGEIRRHPRWAWTACSVLSILSSRCLLIELNVHYPLHLLLLQLAIATTVAMTLYFRSHSSSVDEDEATRSQWMVLIILAILMSAASILGLQAILHFLNLPTLIMLTTVSYSTEAWIYIALSRNPRTRLEFARAFILTLSCAGILLAEYRLLVAGLLTAIPATMLSGLARSFNTCAKDYFRSASFINQRINLVYCCTGIIITSVCTMHRDDETWIRFYHAVETRYTPILVVNVLTTVAAMLLGQSFVFPVSTMTGERREYPRNSIVNSALSLLIMTGIIGLTSSLDLRRTFTSIPQALLFLISAVMVWIGEAVGTSSLHDWRGTYKVLPSESALVSMDSEGTVVSEDSESTYVVDVDERRNTYVFRLVLVAVALMAFWLPFTVLNFSERLFQETTSVSPTLDLDYKPQTPVEVVINMYMEPVDGVESMISRLKAMPNLRHSQFHIYIKDDQIDTDLVRTSTRADNVTVLPNVGREGETYLHHILTNWNDLAKHTIFLQADIHNPRELYTRVQDYFDPIQTGMLSLGWSGLICNCDECSDRFGFSDSTHLFPEIHKRIDNSTQCDKVLLNYKGQFIASAKRIRGIDKSIYHDLHEAFVDKDSWAHKEEYLQGRPDSMSAPVFGYTMERIWNLLFQCNSMDVAWKCPSMLSGNRIGGSIEDCQCFDPVSYT